MNLTLEERLERRHELLDLYDLITPYWREWAMGEARAVLLELLDCADPPAIWMR